MKKLIFLLLSVSLFSSELSDAIRERNAIEEQKNLLIYDQNRIKNRELRLKYQEYSDKQRRVELENIKKEQKRRKSEKLAEEAEREARNAKAREKNRLHYEKLLRDDSNIEDKSGEYYRTTVTKYNPDDFKGKPQLKLGKLHILGITSIKPFKNNQLIIKAANGTFALPREKFEEAEKINFTSDLMQ